MPIARLHVFEPVVLLGHVEERLGQQCPVGHEQAQLAPAGLERGPVHADQVAYVERYEEVERLVAEHVLLGVKLELAGTVHEVDERRPALVAPRDHAAGHAVGAIGLLTRLQVVDDGGGGNDPLEVVRERVDALRPESFELRAAVVHRGKATSARSS
jgi:hypothetical protein